MRSGATRYPGRMKRLVHYASLPLVWVLWKIHDLAQYARDMGALHMAYRKMDGCLVLQCERDDEDFSFCPVEPPWNTTSGMLYEGIPEYAELDDEDDD